MDRLALGLSIAVAALSTLCRGDVVGDPQARLHAFGSEVLADLDGDGHTDLQLSAVSLQLRAMASVGAANGSDLTFTADALGDGSQVDASQTFATSAISISSQVSATEPQLDNPGGAINGDFGFRFTSGGVVHYGWADVSVWAVLGPTGPEAAATVSQWFYETSPNTPITVGAVPEPTSLAAILATAPLLLRPRRPARRIP